MPSCPYWDYRVRGVSSRRVDELAAVLRTQGSAELSSELSVLTYPVHGGEKKYIILDGNHRYCAILKLRSEPETASWFNTVPCRVYQHLGVKEALAIGFGRNRDAEDVLKMDDFSKVEVIRKLLSRDENMDVVYDLLKAQDVSKL